MPHLKRDIWKIIRNSLGVLRQREHLGLYFTIKRNIHHFISFGIIENTILHIAKQPTFYPQSIITPIEDIHPSQAGLQLMQISSNPETCYLPPCRLVMHLKIIQPQLLHELRHHCITIRKHLWSLGSVCRRIKSCGRHESAVRGDIYRRADGE